MCVADEGAMTVFRMECGGKEVCPADFMFIRRRLQEAFRGLRGTFEAEERTAAVEGRRALWVNSWRAAFRLNEITTEDGGISA